MIGQGMNTVQIADKLELSPKTIESHRKVIKTKLNLQASSQLSRGRISVGSRELVSRLQILGRAADHRLHLGSEHSQGFRRPVIRRRPHLFEALRLLDSGRHAKAAGNNC